MNDLWRDRAAANTHLRFPWRKLFGMTLTEKITTLHNDKGLNQDEIYTKITSEHPHLTPEAQDRLRISISARFAEQRALLKRIGVEQ